MNTLRSAAHLQREIGDDLFSVLVSSDNTEVVRQFAQGLAEKALPTEMTVGGRIYDILGFLKAGETSIVGHTMVERAKEMNANLGKEDGEYILKHQQDIPVALRGKVVFVFTDWRHPDSPENAYYVYWHDDSWVQLWHWLGSVFWNGSGRLLRRK